MPVCNHCVDDLYDHYRESLGAEGALRRICSKFDVYWNKEIYGMINKANTSVSRVRSYISKTNLIRYNGKTYDDTLDEETHIALPLAIEDVLPPEEGGPGEDEFKPNVNVETILFWGPGFEEDTYRELDLRYERWTRDLPKPISTVEEALYKQISIQEVQINRNATAGKDIEKGQNALNNLLSSLNVKPNQKKDDSADANLESTPLGVWAKRWEENQPIPDEDIPTSSIISCVITWFYGHLGRAFGLRNVHTKLYDDAIEKYRVTKPEYDEESDDEIMVDVFGENSDAMMLANDAVITDENSGGEQA